MRETSHRERPERTETIEVTPEILQRIARDEKTELREFDESELDELAGYLEVKPVEAQPKQLGSTRVG